MATATFAARLNLDLTILIADQAMIDMSRQQSTTATQDATKTTRVCQMAAAKVESRLGAAGSYDDTDGLIGNQIFLDFGIRIALMYYSQIYTFTLKDAGVDYLSSVMDELEEYRATLVQEAVKTVVARQDNDVLNKRRNHSTWGTTADPAAPPEV